MTSQTHGMANFGRNDWKVGYCTNVHPGVDLETARANLLRYAVPVQQAIDATKKLPVGLWLAEPAARSLREKNEIFRFRDWLHEHALLPFTFNGFPQGDFHQAIVKHRVYLPTWETTERRDYTLLLIDHLHALLPEGEIGSISTLPLGWGTPDWSEERLQKAAIHLEEVADYLSQLEEREGRRIVIAIEPEPGCTLDTSADVVQFFNRFLSSAATAERNRRYLTVCHDICHAAVMFETQKDFFHRLKAEGLLIGKVQVSAALEARWSELSLEQKRSGILFLNQFAEDRYLHQTGVRSKSGFELWEDLPELLSKYSARDLTTNEFATSHKGDAWAQLDDSWWRVHFHVPICEAAIGELHSTQAEIKACMQLLQSAEYATLCPTGHLEIETYAWSVIPAHLRRNDLATSITNEVSWLRNYLAQLG